MSTLNLESAGLDGARTALAAPARRPLRSVVVLACAALMAVAALAVCAVVLVGGWTPQAGEGPPAEVREPLGR